MGERRQGRVHNAEGAREAILSAATGLFAAHGFEGTHIHAIAEAAGYTKSMIFHYFGDKVGLYTAVIEHMVSRMLPTEVMEIMAKLMADEETPRNAHKLKLLLETVIRGNFDILQAHPQSRRLLIWEAAEEWQTTKLIFSKFPSRDGGRFGQIIDEAQAMGIVRPHIDFAVLLTFIQDSALLYLAMLPRLQIQFNNEEMATKEALAMAREQIVQLVIHGVMTNPPEA